MRVNPLLSSILQAPFLLEGQAMQLLYAEIAQLLNGHAGGEAEVVDATTVPFYAITPHAAALGTMGYASLNEVPAGSIAVHTVAGVMLPEDTWWGLGTKTIGQRLQQADAHENIIAHVGVFRTPGGSTMGLENFAATIAGTRKPFVGYAEQACSAGYWSISGANVIMLAGRTAMCGSIGTMAEFLDFSGMFEKMGIKLVTANATKSTNKNAAFKAAVDGDVKPLQQELLDPLNEVFLSTVQVNRDGKLDPKQEQEVLSGGVYVGQANLDNGLADLMGTLDEAIALAQQLADEADDSTDTSSSTSHPMFNKNKFSAVAALAGLAAAAITPELVTAANDELEEKGVTGAALIGQATFEALEAKAGRVDAAETTAKGFTDALAAAGAKDIAELVSQRDGYKVKADKFDKGPGAHHTNPTLKAGTTDVEAEEPNADQQAIAELPHNKALDNHPIFGKAS
jgi:ClpP class serine protease